MSIITVSHEAFGAATQLRNGWLQF